MKDEILKQHNRTAELAGRLKAARQAAGFTQAELAKRAGIAQQNISAVETGRIGSSSDLPALANACGVSINWLYDGSGEMYGSDAGRHLAELSRLSLSVRSHIAADAHLDVAHTALNEALRLLEKAGHTDTALLRKVIAEVSRISQTIKKDL